MSEQQIEGLPLGTRIKSVDHSTWSESWFATLEPDNSYGVLDLTTVKIPDGYKRAEKDWFRAPLNDEFFVSSINGSAVMMTIRNGYEGTPRIILESIKRTQTVVILEYEVVDRPSTDLRYVSRERAEYWVKQYPELNARFEEREVKP